MEAVEAGSHGKAIGAHHAHLDPVSFPDILRQQERRSEDVVRIAGRSIHFEPSQSGGERSCLSNDPGRAAFLGMTEFLERAEYTVIQEDAVSPPDDDLQQGGSRRCDEATPRLAQEKASRRQIQLPASDHNAGKIVLDGLRIVAGIGGRKPAADIEDMKRHARLASHAAHEFDRLLES